MYDQQNFAGFQLVGERTSGFSKGFSAVSPQILFIFISDSHRIVSKSDSAWPGALLQKKAMDRITLEQLNSEFV
ncbi:hypothetical protein SDJN02_13146, partial [Cucurbita argyrosperma subsp. argyrosperma]